MGFPYDTRRSPVSLVVWGGRHPALLPDGDRTCELTAGSLDNGFYVRASISRSVTDRTSDTSGFVPVTMPFASSNRTSGFGLFLFP